MSRRAQGAPVRRTKSEHATNEDFDLQQLLHPAGAYTHPRDVLRDEDLTLNEKRAVLASWASDASAVASMPAMRRPSALDRPVPFDDIMEALRALDQVACKNPVRGQRISTKSLSPWRWPRRRGGRPEARP